MEDTCGDSHSVRKLKRKDGMSDLKVDFKTSVVEPFSLKTGFRT